MGITKAKVTSKGQLTVPKAIRDLLSIREGDEVVFIPDGKRVIMERIPGKVPSSMVFGRLHRPGMQPLDFEKARVQIKGARAKRYYQQEGTKS